MTPANKPTTLTYSQGEINSWKQNSLFWSEKQIEDGFGGFVTLLTSTHLHFIIQQIRMQGLSKT